MKTQKRYKPVEFEQILAVTEKAIRIQFLGGQTIWVAKSQIELADQWKPMDHDRVIYITDWIAEGIKNDNE